MTRINEVLEANRRSAGCRSGQSRGSSPSREPHRRVLERLPHDSTRPSSSPSSDASRLAPPRDLLWTTAPRPPAPRERRVGQSALDRRLRPAAGHYPVVACDCGGRALARVHRAASGGDAPVGAAETHRRPNSLRNPMTTCSLHLTSTSQRTASSRRRSAERRLSPLRALGHVSAANFSTGSTSKSVGAGARRRPVPNRHREREPAADQLLLAVGLYVVVPPEEDEPETAHQPTTLDHAASPA